MKTHTHRGLSPAHTHTILITLNLYLTEVSVSAVVQDSVLLFADVSSVGLPVISWRAATAAGIHPIATWQPGAPPNVSSGYESRVQTFPNGSLSLSQLGLRDTGYYIVTVTEASGNSKEAGLLLEVTEVRYEDMQYLAVFLLVLAAISGSLMVSMWLLERLYRSWQRKQHSADLQLELQPLEATPTSTLLP